MAAKTPEPTLNLAEAAVYLGWGQSTLRGKLSDGKGPKAIKLPGSSRWRFRPDDLDAYINGGAIPAGTVNAKRRKSPPAITDERSPLCD